MAHMGIPMLNVYKRENVFVSIANTVQYINLFSKFYLSRECISSEYISTNIDLDQHHNKNCIYICICIGTFIWHDFKLVFLFFISIKQRTYFFFIKQCFLVLVFKF